MNINEKSLEFHKHQKEFNRTQQNKNRKSIQFNGYNASTAKSNARLHPASETAMMVFRFMETHVSENHIAAMVLAAICSMTKEDTAQLRPINETAVVAFGFVESHVPESLRLRVLV